MSNVPPDGSPQVPPGGAPPEPTRSRLDDRDRVYLRWFLGIAAALVVGIAVLSVIVLNQDDQGDTVVATDDTDTGATRDATVAPVEKPSPEPSPEATPEEDAEPEETPEDEPEYPPCPDGAAPDPAQLYGVTGVSNQLNQRAEPSVEGELAGEFPVGTRGLTVTGACSQSADQVIWWEVAVESGTVWVASQYVESEAVLDAGPCTAGTFDPAGLAGVTSIKADVDGDGAEDKVSFYTDGAGVAHGVIEYGYGAVSDVAYPPNVVDIEPTDLATVTAVRAVGLDRDLVIARGFAGADQFFFLFTDGACALGEIGIASSDGTVRVPLVTGDATRGNDLRCAATDQGVQLYDSSWAVDAATGEVTESIVPIELGVVFGETASFAVGTAGPLQQNALGNIAAGEPSYTFGPC